MNKSPDAAPMSVKDLNLHRYLGLWYEIGRLPQPFEPKDGKDVTAHYSLNKDGTVAVVNTAVAGPRWPRKRWTVKRAIGQAIAVSAHTGRLRLSFLPRGLRWLPGTRADHWVLRIELNCRVALVESPPQKVPVATFAHSKIESPSGERLLRECQATGLQPQRADPSRATRGVRNIRKTKTKAGVRCRPSLKKEEFPGRWDRLDRYETQSFRDHACRRTGRGWLRYDK